MPREGGLPPQPRSRASALDRALQVLDQLQATGSPMTAERIELRLGWRVVAEQRAA